MNSPGRELFDALRNVSARTSGALVRKRPDGSSAGAILAESGRVCWARSATQRGRMTDLLCGAAGQVSREVLEEAVRKCRESGRPLGEFLVGSGVVSKPALRHALLRHTCEAIRDLVSERDRWDWVDHRGTGYSPALTFSAADVFSGVHALQCPDTVAEVGDRLTGCVLRGQRGFAVALADDARTPIAHVNCDDLSVDLLADIAGQAGELMGLGAVVEGKGVVVVLERFACAIWRDRAFLHVILDGEDMAFSRLVAQLAGVCP